MGSTQFSPRYLPQDDSDSYYLVGRNPVSPYSGMLLKFDDDGDFQWIRGYGNGGGSNQASWDAAP